jgi:hypothetical protein
MKELFQPSICSFFAYRILCRIVTSLSLIHCFCNGRQLRKMAAALQVLIAAEAEVVLAHQQNAAGRLPTHGNLL